MAIYKAPSISGARVYRTRKRFKNVRNTFNLTYGEVYPVMCKFVLPGDVWKPKFNCLIRYQPTLAPVLTECNAEFRFFFVPLRQVVDNLEEIITGSKNGSLITGSLPVCNNIFKEWVSRVGTPSAQDLGSHVVVHKYSFPAALGVRPTPLVAAGTAANPKNYYYNYDKEVDEDGWMMAYIYKAYCKIIFEYFRDENYQSFDGDFDKFYDYMLGKSSAEQEAVTNGWYFSRSQYRMLQSDNSLIGAYGSQNWKLWFADLNKDYFSSALPWIMKGVQPTINSVMHADFSNSIWDGLGSPEMYSHPVVGVLNKGSASSAALAMVLEDGTDPAGSVPIKIALNKNQITDGGFTAQDIRDMFAETRVFERLARCGSRYVEYLEANFGIAPRDDTLQRPLYLGGYTQPIVTTEVVQTAQDDDNPVGTLRGHGISSGGNQIRPFVATEFGLYFGLMVVKPKTQYLYQMKREYTYGKRFDFVNPSFQLLSEQQVRSLEFMIPALHLNGSEAADMVDFKKINKFTLGYQGMYNELRYDQDLITRDMADNLSYWTQAINPAVNLDGYDTKDTPPLNGVNICLGAYLKSLLRPFEGNDGGFKPMIVDFGLSGSVYRPLVRDPIPGLTDHN